MKFQLTVFSALLFTNVVVTNTAMATKLQLKLAPSPALVKQCNNKTMSNPMFDYEVKYQNGKKYPDGRVAIKPGFECKISKKYRSPYCRKSYKLKNGRCIKILGSIQLN